MTAIRATSAPAGLEPRLLLRGALGGRDRLEPLVPDRLPALDRETVRSLGQPPPGPVGRSALRVGGARSRAVGRLPRQGAALRPPLAALGRRLGRLRRRARPAARRRRLRRVAALAVAGGGGDRDGDAARRRCMV